MSRLLNLVLNKGPVLQVALDLTSIEDALRITSLIQTNISERIVLEAGTPLIKSEGKRAVSLLRAISGDVPIVADTKIADAAGIEVGLFASSGASAVTVLGLAADEVVVEALEKAQEHGVDIVVDLLHVLDPVDRIEKLVSLGAKIIELHVGIDVQRRLGKTAAELTNLVRKIKKKHDIIIGVAGGLRPGRVRQLVDAGADIVVVGGAIVKSEHPAKVVEDLIHELEMKA